MSTIEVVDLTKAYENGSIVAVDGINLDLEHGKFYSLLGSSGCGKSTTLRCVAGLEDPTSGNILLDGADVTSQPPQQRNIEMVFQDIALFPHMTCRENISYGLQLNNVSKEERERRIQEAAAKLEISDQLDQNPNEVSGGQQQRVALARIFVKEPDVLLLDEPMSDLDAKLKERLRVELQELHTELDTTIIYVTHDQVEAMAMSDEIILMNDGRVEQVSSPDEMFNHPETEHTARFIGTPSTNIIGYEIQDGRAHLNGIEQTIGLKRLNALERGSKIGIRPHAFNIGDGDVTIKAHVRVIESHGNEYVLHSTTEDSKEIDIVSDDVSDISTGDTLTVGFNLSDLYVFDEEGKAQTRSDKQDGKTINRTS